MFSRFSTSAFNMKLNQGGATGQSEPPPETEPIGWIGDEALDTSGDNILFYYDFEGANADDKSGNNNHGTIIGNVIQESPEMNGEYYATGDGLSTVDTTTRITTPLTWVKNNGLVMSFWFKSPASNNAEPRPSVILAFNSSTILQIQGNSVLQMKFLPGANLITYGTEYSKWYHFIFEWTGTNQMKIYVDNVLKLNYNVSHPNSPVNLQIISTSYNDLKKAMYPDSGIDDIRFFNKSSLTNEDRLTLSNSLYGASALKLRLTLQTDGTDKTGNYSGVVFGDCIDNTRAKYGSWSLTSDGLVNSTKYIEMPQVDLIHDMGMSMSFWFYNESGISTGDTRMIEADTDGTNQNRFYIEQYRTDRTKFRFGDDANGIFFATPTDAWHKFVLTITSLDYINIWIDDVKQVNNLFDNNIMPNTLDAGWRIGRNISNLDSLCSFGGSIQEFKIWNRVLTDTEIIDVV